MNTLKTIWASVEDWDRARELGISPSRTFREAIRKAIEEKESELNEQKK